MIKVLFKSPHSKNITELEIENTLEEMQKLVCGYIEVVPTDIFDKVFMVVNEEGKIYDLEPNFRYYTDTIVGNVIFVSVDNRGNFKSLSKNQIEAIKKYFGNYY